MARGNPPGLDPEERPRATARASFRGAFAATIRSTFSPAATRQRRQAFAAWEAGARAAGFDVEEPEMVLGVTDRRLVAWRTSFVLNQPVDISASLPVERIREVGVARRGWITTVAFVVDNAVVEVEAMRGRRLRRLAHETRRASAEKHGRA